MTSQARRSCASIPANIAEGCGRNGDAELCRFRDNCYGFSN
ncbi:MAG: four helix bundle protein [Microcoleaceae cyanobacterium MO_207.B10]|nr:four helix bundle protein [Microcoleaceae cyanobacterium MO_207.B10]